MGNNGSKNDDFSRNPNFNIDQHNQAMRQLQANYTEHNYQMNQGGMYVPKQTSRRQNLKQFTELPLSTSRALVL